MSSTKNVRLRAGVGRKMCRASAVYMVINEHCETDFNAGISTISFITTRREVLAMQQSTVEPLTADEHPMTLEVSTLNPNDYPAIANELEKNFRRTY